MTGMYKSITIFGSTGDLSQHKLFPGLYQLFVRQQLNEIKIIAIGRRTLSQKEFKETLRPIIQEKSRFEVTTESLDNFFKKVIYFKMEITQMNDYRLLKNFYDAENITRHLFYFATSPALFEDIIDGIEFMELNEEKQVMIEKPFGLNLKHAKYINQRIIEVFEAQGVYRIDHYLGKEMIQNILSIRFENELFRRCWDKVSIEQIHIQAFETKGILNRGQYYEKAGAMMDMVQNHLMQVLTLILMKQPESYKDIKHQQIEILNALQPIDEVDITKQLLLKQYQGYRDEKYVDPLSMVETYAKLILFVNYPLYNHIPLIIETGKKMKEDCFKVEITFKSKGEIANVLTINIQPEEGMHLKFNVKKPGIDAGCEQVVMEYCQSCQDYFRSNTPDAYERLISACLSHDDSWFSTWEQIILSWSYMDQLKEKYHSLLSVEIEG